MSQQTSSHTAPQASPRMNPPMNPPMNSRMNPQMIPFAAAAAGLIRVYQWGLSPLLAAHCASHCRFLPSCSEYAREALLTHGLVAGGWLALRRICRCHPWGGCGYDPVPATPPFGRSPGIAKTTDPRDKDT